jgi:ABC-2 type transport system ATP-binding protein
MSETSSGPVVELTDVRVEYDGFVALELERLALGGGGGARGGAAIGLLGSNGAGKSTLLRTILGFRRPARGTVRVFGREVSASLLEVRQRIGYVPENDVTSPHHSAVSFVAYCAELCGMPRVDALQATHQVLNFVGLDDERYRKMATYSLGMRQRVKLAQALVHDPELVFLDEPTNGLDPEARVEMIALIRSLARDRGLTVLLSTHLLPDVEATCDEVVVLARGRVRRQGRLASLLASTGRRYEVGYVGDDATVAAALRARGLTVDPTDESGRLLLELGAGGSPSDVIATVTRAGAALRHLEPLTRTLEQVFLDAVQEEAPRAGL